MAWRDELYQASFRGVQFECEAASGEGGRRSQLHEYPNKNVPFVEDMGKKAQTFSLDAIIIGDDYIQRMKELRAALDEEGAGILSHPSLGEISVVCDSYSVSERYTTEGRSARISLSFTESGVQVMPSVAIDTRDKITSVASAAELSIIGNFEARFSVVNQGTAVTQGIAGALQGWADGAADAIAYANSKIYEVQDQIQVVTDTIDDLTNVANQLDDMSRNALSILDTPDVIAARVSALFGVLLSALSPLDALRKSKSSANIDTQSSTINTDTPKGVAQVELTEQLARLTERTSITYQARAIANVEFTNTDDVQQTLDDFDSQIDAQLLSASPADNATIEEMLNLRDAVVAYLKDTIRQLPDVKIIRLAENTPLTVLAYDLYNDISRAQEIMQRNRGIIAHPGFVPAGRDIEVLSR